MASCFRARGRRAPAPVLLAVAAAVAVAGCHHGGMPPSKPYIPVSEIPAPSAEEAPAVAGRAMLVGELCSGAAEGRPAIVPMFLRRGRWRTKAAAMVRAIDSRSARQFSILGWDGHRIGVFSALGAADAGAHREVAVGSYAGSPTCSRPLVVGKAPRSDPTCLAALGRCAVAIAALEPGGGPRARPFEEDPLPPQVPIAGACVMKGDLVVDIDADGRPEHYPLSEFFDPHTGRPARQVIARHRGGASGRCTSPAFALRLPAHPGKVGLDLLGVLDLDDDGHRELLLQYELGGVTLWAVYTARATPMRLDRAAVAVAAPGNAHPGKSGPVRDRQGAGRSRAAADGAGRGAKAARGGAKAARGGSTSRGDVMKNTPQGVKKADKL